MADDVVSRADSLMRRRSFVAAKPQLAELDIPLLTEEISLTPRAEDDIPVLTEEVFPDTPSTAPQRDKFDETIATRLASEFAHSLERRLAAELPTLVEASLAVLEADLRRGILDIANDAIKDFVARREQLRLPLEDPESDGK
jgi:hypothetical protein